MVMVGGGVTDGGMVSMRHQWKKCVGIEKRRGIRMSYLVSECCSAPPLNNTDVHDGIAMCDQCKEWCGFYDEEEEEEDE